MAVPSLLDLEPHKVSRDLKGYSVLMYGDAKTGKTTTASKFPKALILAFEVGYNALPGVFPVNMSSWIDFINILRQLEQPEVKEKFQTIIVDTGDLAWECCNDYICSINGVADVSEIPYGKGFNLVKKEYDNRLRKITLLGYGLVIISHAADKTFKDENGVEYNKIIPTLPSGARLICSRMCDIIGYSRPIETAEGLQTYFFMRGTPRFEAGSRFKYTPDHILFSYDNLVNAIADAIDKEAADHNGNYITDEAIQGVQIDEPTMTFDEVMEQIDSIIADKMAKDPNKYAPLITKEIENILGKGQKVTNCTYEHIDFLIVILERLKSI